MCPSDRLTQDPGRRHRHDRTGDSDPMIAEGERLLVERGFLKSGDTAIVVAGFTELRRVANMVKIVRV